MNLKTKGFTKSPCIRFDLGKLKDLKIAEVFQAKISGQFAAVCVLDSNVDIIENSQKKALDSAATELLGRQRKKILLWKTNEVPDLCDQRR